MKLNVSPGASIKPHVNVPRILIFLEYEREIREPPKAYYPDRFPWEIFYHYLSGRWHESRADIFNTVGVGFVLDKTSG